MANVKESLDKIMQVEGAVGACVVDSSSGMMLGAVGGSPQFNIEVAAASNTEVVRAKRKAMKALNLDDRIEDILITLGKQYHIIRLCAGNDALFIYVVLDKLRANLAMARLQIGETERSMQIA